jgi:hypothetical protein
MGTKIPTRWYRVTDDVFGTWRGTTKEFKEFVRLCNGLEPRINITYEVSRDEVIFLDVRVTRLAGGVTRTALYTKETDRQRYRHVRSDNPEHTKKGIAKGQLRRLRRICLEENKFKQNAKKLRKKMVARGY